MTKTDIRLRKDEGMRRASLHFAEDFVLDLDERDKGIYITNARNVQNSAKKNFGHELNLTQIEGLIIFIQQSGRLHKDNQQIFKVASIMCDMLDDSLDIRKRR